MKKSSFLLLLLAFVLLFSSCGQLPKLSPAEGGYRHSKSHELYVEGPLNYLSATRSKEAVANLVNATGQSPLYDSGNGFFCDESGALFVPEGTTFPSLYNFSPTRLSICKEETIRVELASSSDADLLQSLALDYLSSSHVVRKESLPEGFPESRYLLLFSSESYPNLLYRLEYFVFEKGEDPYGEWPYLADWIGFLYNRETNGYRSASALLYDLLTGGIS